MARKKTSAYEGPEMHVKCMTSFKRTRLEDRTLIRCPKCNFLYVSVDTKLSD